MTDNKLSLTFTGDIGFDKYMDKRWNDEQLVSDDILGFMHNSDHVIVDVEAPIFKHKDDKDAKGIAQLTHAINPDAVGALKHLGADVWNICNNHMMNLGEKGLYNTLDIAKKSGVKTIGAGRNICEAADIIYYDEAGGVGLFAFGYYDGCVPATDNKGGCLTWRETSIIRDNIKRIKEKCRHCIIVFHGGEEFSTLPVPYVRDRLRSFLDMGADIIVCHHPHVPMNYEMFGEKIIFYSLGNFIYDTDYQRAQINTDIGVVLKINLDENGYDFEAIGTKIDRTSERVIKGKLPDIFCEVNEEEYAKLIPLACKTFLEMTKRLASYVFPDKYKDYTEKDWKDDFLNPNRLYRLENELQDLRLIYEIALQEENKAWQDSKLDKVINYLLSLSCPCTHE